MKIFLDNKTYEAKENETILNFLLRNNIHIPFICYQQGLGPLESCDTCVVEVDGHLVRACSTKLYEGMKILITSKKVEEARKKAFDRILTDHYLYCTLCDKSSYCFLRYWVLELGIEHQNYRPKGYPIDDSNPFYVYDPNQCILCGRCVEACQDLVVNEVIHIDWNLSPPRVVWDHGTEINKSSCVSCGTCVTVCPVNALMEKKVLGEMGYFTGLKPNLKQKLIQITKEVEKSIGGFQPILELSELDSKLRTTIFKRTKTVCMFCGVGCSFEVWTKGNKIVKVQPSPNSPANGLATCIKGKFGWDFINDPSRLTKPLIREGDHFREATWEEAINLIANKIKEIKEKYGPDAIGIIANCTGSNEEAYLAQKLARQVIGTNNVDNCARYCQAPATTGLFRTVGIGADAGTMEDIYNADLVITMGSNTAESHPVLAGKIKRAKKLRGQKLIVIDVRKHEMAERADIFVKVKPGTDLVLLNAISKYIIDQGWEDKKFIQERTVNFEEYKKYLEKFTLDYAEKITGVSKDTIIKVAEMIHNSRNVCVCYAMGITQHQSGSETSTAISNLLLLTGNYGRPACGAYPLRGHANVQGASDFGALPAYMPGYERVDSPEVRERYEKEWKVKLPEKPGLTSTEMIDAIYEGKLKLMLIFGEDKVLADSNRQKTEKALEMLDFLVVTELFMTQTTKLADVILPAAASVEKDGTYVNTERRIQRFYKALEPPGECRPEWQILQDIANSLGAKWNYKHPSEIMDEAAKLCPVFAGVNYQRLEGYKSLLWPVSADGRDTPYLYKDKFNFPDGKARFYPPKYIEPLETSESYDLYLNNGRMLEHFHWGNISYRTAGIKEKVPNVFIEVSPELAKERGLNEGDLVRIVSPVGSIKARVVITSRVEGKNLFLAIHNNMEETVNTLTTDFRDPTSKTPAYKELPVRIEKIEEGKGIEPLPLINPRYYKGVSQIGIKVEEKWKRPEYAPIAERIEK
jgi:formate dehydrogenase, alpha subunit, archaeal-type